MAIRLNIIYSSSRESISELRSVTYDVGPPAQVKSPPP